MTRVFISYSRNDGNNAAERLQRELEAQGFDVWRDVRNIDPAQDFTADIERGIEGSDWVAVCITPDTKRDNSFVRREIHYAQMTGKPVIPLRFAEIVPHISISTHEWVDFFKGWDSAFARICEIFGGAAEPFRTASSSADPFRPYVEYLYQRCVEYFKHSIIGSDPIDLTSERTENAVAASPAPPQRFDPFDQLFFATGITPEAPESEPEDKPKQFARFADAFEYYGGRVLLLGEPGAGKTITLMAHTRNAAAARLDDPSVPLPLFQIIPLWDAEEQTPLDAWLAESYGNRLALDAVQREIKAGRVLFLLDGLDELGGERENPDTKERYDPRKRFMSVVGEGLQTLPGTYGNTSLQNRTLVTCRVKDYAAIGWKIALNGAVTLNPLTDDQIRDYLGVDSDLWVALAADDDLREVARTPLLMALFAEGYRENAADAAELRDLSASPGALRDAIFERYINQRYAWEDRKHGPLAFTLDEIYDVLGHVAMKYTVEENLRDSRRGIIRAHGDLQPPEFMVFPEKALTPAFVELAVRLHLLALQSYGRQIRFTHFLLRTTLAYNQALSALRDSNKWIRELAVDALGIIGDARAVDPLIASFHGSDEKILASISHALGQIGDIRAITPLIAVLRDAHPKVHFSAFAALRMIGESAVEPLITVLNDTDVWVRAQAASALGEIGDVRASEPLITALNDTDVLVRVYAASALGEIGDARASEPLITALNDTDVLVRAQAASALVLQPHLAQREGLSGRTSQTVTVMGRFRASLVPSSPK